MYKNYPFLKNVFIFDNFMILVHNQLSNITYKFNIIDIKFVLVI